MTMASRVARKTFSVGEVAADYCRRWILAPDADGGYSITRRLSLDADDRG